MRKNWVVRDALRDNAWVRKINPSINLTVDHIIEFVDLWIRLEQIQLQLDINDDIIWRFEANGEYSATSAYRVQFLGSTSTTMNKTIWKVWAPPKVKFFSWLTIQNRIWTADRLEKRGWENCGLCTLCKRANETSSHLFFKCRFAMRVWRMVKDWLGLGTLEINGWAECETPRLGGPTCRSPTLQTGRPWPPSPCLSVGSSGTRGTHGFSKRNRHHPSTF